MKLNSKECQAVLLALDGERLKPSQRRALGSAKAKLEKGASV